ncbi:hypothetical protein GBAR_LOCUS1250 [Geodia barretti]|uniref:Uncharacterized protein n=1 Tax=Geodia barretti TaxID=519541 RepID=A0AA35QV62_GEOBA|nr:hypothetical protein GBAR_LOCUS1250 [Geodia barretti]
MSLSLEELVLEIKAIYEPLLGMTFEGSIHEENTPAVCTGGPRDVVNVRDQGVIGLMETIVDEVERVSKKVEPYNNEEKVWKGITPKKGPTKLWVKSLKETYKGDRTTFTVANIEVLTGLNWQKSYRAMVHITLV